MNLFGSLKNTRGVTLVETLIATALFLIVVTGFSAALSLYTGVSERATMRLQALLLAEGGADAVRFIRDNSYASIDALSEATDYKLVENTGAWSLAAGSETIGDFTRTVRAFDIYRDADEEIVESGGTIDEGMKKIDVEVIGTQGDLTETVTLEFLVGNLFGS